VATAQILRIAKVSFLTAYSEKTNIKCSKHYLIRFNFACQKL
jgi:hypothetical protein